LSINDRRDSTLYSGLKSVSASTPATFDPTRRYVIRVRSSARIARSKMSGVARSESSHSLKMFWPGQLVPSEE
jgi:hypothetical protein